MVIVDAEDGHGGVENARQTNDAREAREGTPCHSELHCCRPVLATRSVGQGRLNGDAEGDDSRKKRDRTRVLSRRGQSDDGGYI